MSEQAPWEDFQEPATTASPAEHGPWEDFKNADTVEPPKPQATTLLSDKNMVVGHPMDMSHDQVNDAIQTQIYGRPRNDLHQDAPALAPHIIQAFRDTIGVPLALGPTLSPETMKETAKGAVRGIEDIGVGVAGLAKWFGEGVQHDEGTQITQEPVWLRSVGSKTAEMAQKAIDFIHEREQKGFEAPDPEIFRGTFVSNPSVSRIASQVAQGIPILAAATAVSIATGNPAAGLGAMGLMSAGQEYEQNREANVPINKASEAATLSGLGNTLLMSLPMGKLFSGEGGGALRTAAEFAAINTPMVAMNNLIARIGVDKARPLFENWIESTISMAATGGVMGHFLPGKAAEIDSQVQDLHKQGISAKEIDAAREEIGQQLTGNVPQKVPHKLESDNGIQDLQMRKTQEVQRMAEALPSMPREIHQDLAQIASTHQGTEAADELPLLYSRLRETGQDHQTSLSALREYFQSGTSPRLQEALGSDVALPSLSLKASQSGENAGIVQSAIEYQSLKNLGQESIKQATETLKDNPDLRESSNVVYNDILRKLSDIEKPAGIPEDQWKEHNDLAAKVWAARTVNEAVKRGVSVEEMYSQIVPEIVSPQPPQAIEPSPQVPEGTPSAYQAAPGEIYPAIDASSDPIISANPAFHTLRSDAEAVINHYANQRQVKASPEMAQSLFREMHDALGELMRAPADKKMEVKAALEAKYPDMENEFMALHNMEYVNRDKFFAKSMLKDYGVRRPKVGVEAEFHLKPDVAALENGQKIESKPVKFDDNGVPKLPNKSIVSTVTTLDGEDVPITHKMVLEEATAQYDQYKKESGHIDDLHKFALSNKIKTERADAAGKVPEAEENKAIPVRFKNNKTGFNLDVVAQRAFDAGLIPDPSSDTYREAVKAIGRKEKEKVLGDFYQTAQHQLEEDFSQHQQQPEPEEDLYSPLSGDSPDTEVAPGVFFQKDLFNQPRENVADTYERLRQQAIEQGMSPIQASKWAKDKLPNAERLPIEPKAKQTEFGMGGVEGFGQGRQGEQDLFQGEGKNAKGSFTPEGRVIKIMQNADASTFMHESAHLWLQNIHDYMNEGKANESYKADWKTLSDWLGVKEGAKEINREQHEQFARGFEAYLREGNAPSAGLQRVFERFKQWLTQVYHSARLLNVKLTDDVRGVMDRMLKVPEREAQNEYVINKPFDIKIGENDEQTGKSIVEELEGNREAQVVRGNQLAEDIRRSVRSKDVDRAMIFYGEANGDLNVLADALSNPKFENEKKYLELALNLPERAKEAMQKGSRYYDESGRVGLETGALKKLRENYQNRIYEPEPPQDFVKTELSKKLKQGTSHSKQRVYDTLFDAIENGKELKSGLGYSDLLAIHNEEMAGVNTARNLAEAMKNSEIGAWKKDKPEGWEQIGNLEKRVPLKNEAGEPIIAEDGNQAISSSKYYAPEGIAKIINRVLEPDYIKKMANLSTLAKYQGLTKTLNLGLFSYFHHWNFVKATISNGGISNLIKMIHLDEHIHSDFNKYWEQDMAQHLGKTPLAEDNLDILRHITEKNPDTFSKVMNLPIVKQGLERTEKNANFLFGKMQRFLKVSEYARSVSDLVSKKEMTDEKLKDAKKELAKFANDQYGGQNWQAAGMTKSNLSLLRLWMLAPDWFYSNNNMIKNTFLPGVRGNASRKFMLTGLVGGILATESLNKMFTGHFTDENKKGHGLDVEISPDVYVNFFPAPVAEAIKMYSMVRENGLLLGPSRYLQGKGSPLARAALLLASRRTYSGKEIKTTMEMMKQLALTTLPIPITISNLRDYLEEEPNKTLRGGLAVATGLGRYSKSKSGSSKVNF